VTFYSRDPDNIVPGGSSLPARPGDVCPSSWTEDFDRSQMSTEVLIGRTLPSNIPDIVYTYAAAIPPGGGGLALNGANQLVATVLYLSRTNSTGGSVSAWLRYIGPDTKIRITGSGVTGQNPDTLDDIIGQVSLTYSVTAATTFHTSYVSIPVAWTDGETPMLHGKTTIQITLGQELPDLYYDAYGRAHYGRETFTRTDLISATRSLFLTLADRILEVRGSNSVPRVDSVTVDARQGRDFPMLNMELMSLARPELPSRTQLRLQVNGRIVYNRHMFVTSVRHSIERDEWTATLTFDVAEWAAQL
jgi:hypothetical protein